MTATAYDLNANKISVTDPDGHATGYAYDAADQLTTVNRADGTSLGYGYDADGSRTSSRDGANQTATTAYNDAAFPWLATSETDRLNRTTSVDYDRAANRAHLVDPSSRTTTLGYDAANQLTSVNYSDPATSDVTSIGYDADGRRTSMTDGTGTSSWTWDSLGRKTSYTNGGGQTVSYGYDLAANLTSITYPASTGTVNRTYDDAGHLHTVTDWLSNTTTFDYDANANATTETLPTGSGVVDTFSFDNNDKLIGVSDQKSAVTFASFGYIRKPSGRVASASPTGVSQTNETYTYDNLNHLSQVNAGTYTYDAAEDLTKLTDGTTQGFDVANAVCWQAPTGTGTCAAPPTGATTFGYDAQGNRTAKTPPAGTATTYTLDQANRMTAAGGTTTASYAYNGDGLRMSKTVNSVFTSYAWDDSGSLPLLLRDGTDAYVYGPDETPIERISGTTPTWLHADQIGSVRVITDSSGLVSGTYSYDAYGRQTGHTGTATTPMQFVGQYTDAETGLIYLRARYYDPTTGSFTGRDPVQGGSATDYDYVDGDPINNSDLDGLMPGDQQDPGWYKGLTDAERNAYENKLNGDPYDPKLFNRADKKRVKSEKEAGERNAAKRQQTRKSQGKSNKNKKKSKGNSFHIHLPRIHFHFSNPFASGCSGSELACTR
jgi:RHS repeat-associated protein